jgi:glycine dehydrogenase subunit 1
VQLADRLGAVPGVAVVSDTFFNEFTVKLPKPAAGVVEALAKRKILGGVPVSRLYPGRAELANLLVVAATETNTEEEIAALGAALQEVLR